MSGGEFTVRFAGVTLVNIGDQPKHMRDEVNEALSVLHEISSLERGRYVGGASISTLYL